MNEKQKKAKSSREGLREIFVIASVILWVFSFLWGIASSARMFSTTEVIEPDQKGVQTAQMVDLSTKPPVKLVIVDLEGDNFADGLKSRDEQYFRWLAPEYFDGVLDCEVTQVLPEDVRQEVSEVMVLSKKASLTLWEKSYAHFKEIEAKKIAAGPKTWERIDGVLDNVALLGGLYLLSVMGVIAIGAGREEFKKKYGNTFDSLLYLFGGVASIVCAGICGLNLYWNLVGISL